jgi:hypothetical protein
MSFNLEFTLYLSKNVRENLNPIFKEEYENVKLLENYINEIFIDKSIVNTLASMERSKLITFKFADRILNKAKRYGCITSEDAILLYYTYLQNLREKNTSSESIINTLNRKFSNYTHFKIVYKPVLYFEDHIFLQDFDNWTIQSNKSYHDYLLIVESEQVITKNIPNIIYIHKDGFYYVRLEICENLDAMENFLKLFDDYVYVQFD